MTRSAADGFLCKWGSGPLTVYLCGIALPAIVAFPREELMLLLGLPFYAVLFWTGPFASAAAVFWSSWSVGWRIIWLLLVPALAAASLGLLLFAIG